jgi:hypothetical protein
LNNIKNYLTKSFVLTENLSSTTDGYFGSGDNWAPIGRPAQQMFTGNFNGNGHTISDLITTQTGGLNTLGLFGYSRGNISNLGLINVKVVGRAYLGGLVGNMLGGTITSSYTTGSVTGDNGVSSGRSGDIGGLVGRQAGGTITNSYSTANVSGAYSGSIGGLVGYLNAGTASNSYSTGRVLSTTSVSNRNAIGGLVGYVFQGYVTNSFWDVNTSGQLNMCHSEYSPRGPNPEVRNGCDKANGKTTAEMKTLSTFATWDTSKWNFVEGFYPALKTP